MVLLQKTVERAFQLADVQLEEWKKTEKDRSK